MQQNVLLLLAFGIALIYLLLLMRRQQKRVTEIKAVQAALVPGDRVVTTSGVHGVVREVRETEVTLELAPGIVTTWERMAVLRNAEPSNEESTNEEQLPTDEN